jgi:hypothetical protein
MSASVFAKLPVCPIGIEACATAHFGYGPQWRRPRTRSFSTLLGFFS